MAAIIGREIPPASVLASYDIVVVAFSGGKDSISCLIELIERGVDPRRIELHHHDVDGQAEPFIEWPSTIGYCRAVARSFDVPLYLSWREGGFLREMLRHDQPTAPIRFERPDGTVGVAGGNGPHGTRERFPQLSADLRVRWCSPYTKIDVLAAAIRGQERFRDARTLVVTGERGEESPCRAAYATFEAHRTDARHGAARRVVDHWRPVHGWDRWTVWRALARHGVVPAPAYRLGWSRLSCFGCIFSSPDQWATLRAIAPERFRRFVEFEACFGLTIRPGFTLREIAERGRPYPAALTQPRLARQALATTWRAPVRMDRTRWRLPAGAGAEAAGPS